MDTSKIDERFELLPNVVVKRVCKTAQKRKIQVNTIRNVAHISFPIGWFKEMFPNEVKLQGKSVNIGLVFDKAFSRKTIIIFG